MRIVTIGLLLFFIASRTTVGDDFFIVDSLPDSLLVGQVGVNNSDRILSALTPDNYRGLSKDFTADSILACADNYRRIYRLSTADGSLLETIAIDRKLGAIAMDTATGLVYAIPEIGQPAELLRVDLATGTTESIAPLSIGLGGIFGLTFDPVTQRLFAPVYGSLYSIDPGTGEAELIGSMGTSQPYGIDYNPNDGLLYVIDAAPDILYSVDRLTGERTFVNRLGMAPAVRGLAIPIPAPGTAVVVGLLCLIRGRARR